MKLAVQKNHLGGKLCTGDWSLLKNDVKIIFTCNNLEYPTVSHSRNNPNLPLMGHSPFRYLRNLLELATHTRPLAVQRQKVKIQKIFSFFPISDCAKIVQITVLYWPLYCALTTFLDVIALMDFP